MIDIHVLVPYTLKGEITAMVSPEFEIVATNKSRQHEKDSSGLEQQEKRQPPSF